MSGGDRRRRRQAPGPRQPGEERQRAGPNRVGRKKTRPRPPARVSQDWRDQIDRLLKRAADHGIEVDPGSAGRLEAYCRAVVEWSDRAGLVSPGDLQRFVEKHVASSLGPLLLVKPSPRARWIDVGTGAGLPGLVVKLCCPDLHMTLIESSRKKTIFLERVREALGLTSLEIVEARVESLLTPPIWGSSARAEDHPGRPGGNVEREPGGDVILMRAVAALAPSLKLIDTLAGVGCRLMTFKGLGWRAELEAARPALQKQGWVFVEAREVPWAMARVLLLVRDHLRIDVPRETS